MLDVNFYDSKRERGKRTKTSYPRSFDVEVCIIPSEWSSPHQSAHHLYFVGLMQNAAITHLQDLKNKEVVNALKPWVFILSGCQLRAGLLHWFHVDHTGGSRNTQNLCQDVGC